jgi:hypothetical protein
VDIQLIIARRADELTRARGRDGRGKTDLDCWLAAEREVLGRVAEPVSV